MSNDDRGQLDLHYWGGTAGRASQQQQMGPLGRPLAVLLPGFGILNELDYGQLECRRVHKKTINSRYTFHRLLCWEHNRSPDIQIERSTRLSLGICGHVD